MALRNTWPLFKGQSPRANDQERVCTVMGLSFYIHVGMYIECNSHTMNIMGLFLQENER